MRNLVPELQLGAAVCVVGLGLGLASCATQRNNEQAAAQTDLPVAGLVERNIGPLRLSARSEGASLELTVRPGSSYLVEVTQGAETDRADSETCLPLRALMDAYRTLPPIRPGPVTLTPEGRNLAVPRSRTPHAPWWRWRVHGFTPDGASLQMELEGSQGPYPEWLTQTVDAVGACRR